jgi:hypothetical protein
MAACPSGREHLALLQLPGRFDSLCRRVDLLGEGVTAVFALQGEKAELRAVLFQPTHFTPDEAQRWLRERRLSPVLFTRADRMGAASPSERPETIR